MTSDTQNPHPFDVSDFPPKILEAMLRFDAVREALTLAQVSPSGFNPIVSLIQRDLIYHLYPSTCSQNDRFPRWALTDRGKQAWRVLHKQRLERNDAATAAWKRRVTLEEGN